MSRMKIGYHTGPGGIGVPRVVYEALNEHSIPYFAKGVDAFPYDAQLVATGSSVEHTIVFRRSVPHEGTTPPSGNPDVPDYSKDPVTAAIDHYTWHRDHIPPEMNRNLVWLEIINEVDKNRAEWLAEFGLKCGQMALNDGVRLGMFGWSTGEPEPEHWQGPKMLECLQFYGEHPEQLAIAVHEYSLHEELTNDFPYLVGRYQTLYSICDSRGIPRPTVLITEFGWKHTWVPDPGFAIPQLIEVGELYATYDELKGAAIWYLGGGWEDIADRVAELFNPLLEATLTTEYDDPEPPPPPPAECEPRVPYNRTYNVIPSDATEARAVEIFLEGWRRSRETAGGSYDDAMYGPGLNRVLARLYDIPYTKHQEFIDWRDTHYPSAEIEFAGDSGAPPEFVLTHWPTEYKVITQVFGNNPEYYLQFGLPGHEGVDIRAYTSTRIFAAAPGRVVLVQNDPTASNYGIHIKLDHGDNHQTLYAHLQSANVVVGQQVVGGQLIGLADNTGLSFGSHLHFGYYIIGETYTDEHGTWPNYIHDPTTLLLPLMDGSPPPIYTGPPVVFQPGVDQPASDWYWPTAKAVFDVSGLGCKFHTTGDSHQWYNQYKKPFTLVRIALDPTFVGDIYAETVNNVARFYDLGARDFEVLNEPNIEGMGTRWNNGTEFGIIFKDLCAQYLNRFPGIRLWFPGCSPGFGAQYAFIDAAVSAGAFTHIYGMCEHVYSGTTTDYSTAYEEMYREILEFRGKYAMTRPLAITEFSVNRPASGSYKASAYKLLYEKLAALPGVQAAYSFTSSWYPHSDPNQEGWLENGIHNEF